MSEYSNPPAMPDPTAGIDTVNPDPLTQPQPSKEPKVYDLSNPIITLPDNITIREIRHSDAGTMSKHASNRKIARNMTNRFPYPYSVDKAHDWIAMVRNENNWVAIGPTDPKSNNTAGMGQRLPHAWGIAVNDEVVGGIGFHPQTDVHARRAPFGYWLGEEHWGRGIMSQVVPAFVEWLWENYPWLVKLEPGAYGWNPASARVLEKAGFVLEGRMRCSIERDGVIGDILTFGMVRAGIVASDIPPEP